MQCGTVLASPPGLQVLRHGLPDVDGLAFKEVIFHFSANIQRVSPVPKLTGNRWDLENKVSYFKAEYLAKWKL